ncbi:MAG: isochorismatase family protein [Bacteroidetes bacterium]|nr:isochorismatase family protein [Bacteroidota bacterium]
MKNVLTAILICLCMFSSNLKAQERSLNEEDIKKLNLALLVIDIQNDYLPYMSETDRKSAMDTINKAISIFHLKIKLLGVNTIVLCGLSATGCVLGTYFGGIDHDYMTLMLRDGLISAKTEQTAVIREISAGLDYGALKNILSMKP